MSIPFRSAACSTVSPGSASSFLSSMENSMLDIERLLDFQTTVAHGPAVFDEVFELVSELLQVTRNRHGRSGPQRAHCVPHDPLGDTLQVLDVAGLPLPL